MDIICADRTLTEQGTLFNDYTLDFDTTDSMDYRLTVPQNQYSLIHASSFVYIPNTEYGGIIDTVTHNTGDNTLIVYGRNFRGILNSKIVTPSKNSDYVILTGGLADVLTDVLGDIELDALFKIDPGINWLTVTKYQVPRYCTFLYLLQLLAQKFGLHLRLTWSKSMHKVVISFTHGKDWTSTQLYSQLDMQTSVVRNRVNHLICLGKGELKNRVRVDLYANSTGEISRKQSLFGVAEYVDIYDYPNAQNTDDLIANGAQRFQELLNVAQLELEVKDSGYAVGDIVGGYDELFGLKTKATITNIVVTVDGNSITYNYTVS